MPDVTGLYRARLAAAVDRLLLRVGELWRLQFDPADPQASLALIGQVGANWTTGMQRAAMHEAHRYLQAQIAQASRLPLLDVDPVVGGLELVGSSAAGQPLTQLLGRLPAVYWARLSLGQLEAAAAASSLAYLKRVAGSEPYRVANNTVIDAARDDDRFTGRITRVTQPGACQFCLDLHDRGYIQHGTPAHPVTFAAHANDRCTASAEISTHVTGRRSIRRARRARRAQYTNRIE